MHAVTIIICCHNSALRVPQTLKYISRQQVAKNTRWDVLLVDNNSIDRTAKTAVDTWNELGAPVPLKVVKEGQSGLIYARKRGIKEAKNDIIIFCDDDNWLASNYVQLASELMNSRPEVGVLGGFGKEVGECDLPSWFEHFKENYAVGTQASSSGDVTDSRGYVFGAGMVVRKKALLELQNYGLKSILSGRKKNKLTAGDDSELCQMLRLVGWKIWYDENLVFKHWLPASRLRWTYLVRMNQGFAKANTYLECYQAVYNDQTKRDSPKEIVNERIHKHLLFLKGKIKMLILVLYKGVDEGNNSHLRLYYSLYYLLNLLRYRNRHIRLMYKLMQIKKEVIGA